MQIDLFSALDLRPFPKVLQKAKVFFGEIKSRIINHLSFLIDLPGFFVLKHGFTTPLYLAVGWNPVQTFFNIGQSSQIAFLGLILQWIKYNSISSLQKLQTEFFSGLDLRPFPKVMHKAKVFFGEIKSRIINHLSFLIDLPGFFVLQYCFTTYLHSGVCAKLF